VEFAPWKPAGIPRKFDHGQLEAQAQPKERDIPFPRRPGSPLFFPPYRGNRNPGTTTVHLIQERVSLRSVVSTHLRLMRTPGAQHSG